MVFSLWKSFFSSGRFRRMRILLGTVCVLESFHSCPVVKHFGEKQALSHVSTAEMFLFGVKHAFPQKKASRGQHEVHPPQTLPSTSFRNGRSVLAQHPTTWESPNIRTQENDSLNRANTDEGNPGRQSTVMTVVLALSGLLHPGDMTHSWEESELL